MLKAISPVDGRYAGKTKELQSYFSEYALIRYRVFVEIKYLLFLNSLSLPGFKLLSAEQLEKISSINSNFSEADAARVKEIEKTTNHDIKAVEYLIKEKMEAAGLGEWKEFVHFGLTSQDINNTALPLMLKDAIQQVMLPGLEILKSEIDSKAEAWHAIPMLAKTHGQPATPTSLGKELAVFVERLEDQIDLLIKLPVKGKFGGATGNLNAHKVAYPLKDWPGLMEKFLRQELDLIRSGKTTQIAHYDHMAAIFDNLSRINTILIDFARDIWSYISMEYLKQRVIKGEVGSSTMPHKVNPIDFENAEGNLGVANALFKHLSSKLPVSRLQRDLTDSTVGRNIGLPLAYTLIALKSLMKGLGKIEVNPLKLEEDLESNWAVVTEAIQTILRRENYPKPYEALKELSRGKSSISKADIHAFIEKLDLSDKVKKELKGISPSNYLGFL